MSVKHPIIAVTGSSGADSSEVIRAFENIAYIHGASMAIVDGSGFHRYDRKEFAEARKQAQEANRVISHFGIDTNQFDRLTTLLNEYSEHGTGVSRTYLHDTETAARHGQEPGTFTPWTALPENTDLLFYQGLHGCLVAEDIDVAQYMDLKIGVVPVVNLEWVQKMERDTQFRGYSREAVTNAILRRMPDYVAYIAPQFSHTDINFQQVPMVDTANPFSVLGVPGLEDSVMVIRVKDPDKTPINFPYLLNVIPESFMSRRNTLVIPGEELAHAMELIFTPFLQQMLAARSEAL